MGSWYLSQWRITKIFAVDSPRGKLSSLCTLSLYLSLIAKQSWWYELFFSNEAWDYILHWYKNVFPHWKFLVPFIPVTNISLFVWDKSIPMLFLLYILLVKIIPLPRQKHTWEDVFIRKSLFRQHFPVFYSRWLKLCLLRLYQFTATRHVSTFFLTGNLF